MKRELSFRWFLLYELFSAFCVLNAYLASFRTFIWNIAQYLSQMTGNYSTRSFSRRLYNQSVKDKKRPKRDI